MKRALLLLAMFAMFLTGCTVTTHHIAVAHDHEINPDFYSEITPISATEEGACAITEFYDANIKNFDNIVDIQAEMTRTTMGISVLVISDETTCDYRAFGVKYKDGSKIKKPESKKGKKSGKAAKAPKKKAKKKVVEEDEDEEEEEEDDE